MAPSPRLNSQALSFRRVLLWLFLAGIGGSQAQESASCTSTLADADLNGDSKLTLEEFTGFLQAEANKNQHSSAGAILSSADGDISDLFRKFSIGGTTEGQINIAGAKLLSNGFSVRVATPVNDGLGDIGDQRALLESVCESSKDFLGMISTAATSNAASMKENPFVGEIPYAATTEAKQLLPQIEIPPLQIFGMTFDFKYLQDECPLEMIPAMACLVLNCGLAQDIAGSCSQIIIPSTVTNATSMMEESNVPECGEYGFGLCDALEFPQDCCLTDCVEDLYTVLDCAIQEISGEDRSDCPADGFCADSAGAIGGGLPDFVDVFTSEGKLEIDKYLNEYYGVTIGNTSDASLLCPMEVEGVDACILRKCSYPFVECPRTELPQVPFLEQATATCTEHSDAFCRYFDIPETCCLAGCETALFELTGCMVNKTNAETDLSRCDLPGCVGPVEQFNATAALEEDKDTFIAIEAFEIDLLGMTLNSETISLDHECSFELFYAASCVVNKCSNYQEVCSELIPGGNNNTIANMANNSIMTGERSNCTDLGPEYCGTFSDLSSGCCMSSCVDELYRLSTCALKVDQGKDFTTCQDPECVVDAWSGEIGGGDGGNDFADLDLDSFSFSFFGVDVSAETAQTDCPDAWSATISCVISDCPNFLDVCPIMELEDSVGVSSNTTVGNMTASFTSCSQLGEGFCDIFTGPDECCLSECVSQVYDLVSCMTGPFLGENRTMCETPACVVSSNNDAVAEKRESAILVNSSFLLSSLEGETAAEIREALRIGGTEVLQEAYSNLVQSIIDNFTRTPSRNSWGLLTRDDAERRLGKTLPAAVSFHTRRQMEQENVQLDPSGTVVYGFVDSPCVEGIVDQGDTAVSRQGDDDKTCVTALGRYRVLVDPDEDGNAIYESLVEMTQTAITEGKLQENLEQVAQNETLQFFVAGVSEVVDEAFDPFVDFVDFEATTSDSVTESSGQNGTTSPPTSATSSPTQAPDSSAYSLVASSVSAVAVLMALMLTN